MEAKEIVEAFEKKEQELKVLEKSMSHHFLKFRMVDFYEMSIDSKRINFYGILNDGTGKYYEFRFKDEQKWNEPLGKLYIILKVLDLHEDADLVLSYVEREINGYGMRPSKQVEGIDFAAPRGLIPQSRMLVK